jgi:hypothetical protein
VLFDSTADWISPGFDDVDSPMHDSRWSTNPPANNGAKVIISDTDHYSPMKSDALWAWKSFLRGHNPILYDLGIVTGVNPPDSSSGSPSFASLEPARYAMGDTLRFAREMDLVAMEPRGISARPDTRSRTPAKSTSSSSLTKRPTRSPRDWKPTPTRSGGIASAAARRKTPAR